MRIPRLRLTQLGYAAAGATLVLTTSVGLVAAQTPTPATSPTSGATSTPAAHGHQGKDAARRQAIISDAADQLGLTSQQLAQALQQARASAKGSGATGAARHQAVLAAAAQQLNVSTQQLSQALRKAAKDVGGATGGFRLGQLVRQEIQVAAQTLGLTPQQLHQQLKGHSLTDVANAQNVAPATVANAITTDLDNKIDAAVSAGKIQANRADKLKQKVPAAGNKLMTRTSHAGAKGS